MPHIKPFEMALGEVLHEPGNTLSHVYLPSMAIISLLYEMEDDPSAGMR